MPDLANGKYVSQSDAIRMWWPAAREVLLGTAREYGAWITHDDLSARIQAATGITTKQAAEEWIGVVLSRVAVDAETRGEPRLTSLCVRADLSIGEDYAGAAIGETVQSREQQAAEDRLACYRFHGAELPEDGGRPQLTPRTVAARPTRERKPARERTAAPSRRATPSAGMREVTCTSCFMVVPAAAECRECGAPLGA